MPNKRRHAKNKWVAEHDIQTRSLGYRVLHADWIDPGPPECEQIILLNLPSPSGLLHRDLPSESLKRNLSSQELLDAYKTLT